jgi:RimJ/RimL family protein N-acetyltransferase
VIAAPTITLALFDDWERIWAWVHERPSAHLDDSAGTTLNAFADEMDSRVRRGELVYGVFLDGKPVGSIGYAPISDRVGMLHGVSISRAVSGRGIADVALEQLMQQLTAQGIRKVSASYFADNAHIRACLKRVGFIDEGFLQDHAMQDGRPVSLWLVARMLKG